MPRHRSFAPIDWWLGIILFALALSIVGSGCLLDFARPVYAPDTCEPSDDRYVELAQSRIDHVRITRISSDPGEALAQALEETKRLGLELRRKPTTDTSIDGFSTTLPGVILLAADWDEKPIAEQAWQLWHETVHARQWKRLGPKRFLALYAVPEGRWGLEAAAYAFSFRLQVHLGEPHERVTRAIEEKVRRLGPEYALRPMPTCAIEAAAPIWLAAAGL